jgi:hypothetical protein
MAAKLVSARELSKIVDEAVRAASHPPLAQGAERAAALSAGGGHNVLISPEILGRVLRDAGEAKQFATTVARSVEKSGFSVHPVSFEIGNGIHIAGFVERDSLLQREI